MADSNYAEFSIAHDRLYTLDHLWMQVLDEDKEEGTTSIGRSERVPDGRVRRGYSKRIGSA